MTVFADASAVVKRFVHEEGSDEVLADIEPVVVSSLTRVEVTSAIWRRARMSEFPTFAARRIVDDVAARFAARCFAGGPELAEVVVDERIITSAIRLCAVHDLRAGDAIQLATALVVRDVEPSCTRFQVYDRRLADAAAREGFTVSGVT